ncbi:MAG: GNAT family N-acetyltransferase [Elusimicrobia bacterium]|nr:GNAT family N-acetyltransferase [Elusimicrobiota bacterium]
MRKTKKLAKLPPQRVRCRFVRKPGRSLEGRLVEMYRAAGWWGREDTPALLKKLVFGSHCFIVAEDRGRAVGMGRAIGDRASDAYIQDVFVEEAYRGNGIGAQIVRRIARRLKGDGLRWIGLIAAPGTRSFYEGLGFGRMPRFDPMLRKG